MPEADHCVSVTREISAPPGEVYAAWTEPERMQRWMAQTVEADVRIGGHYRHEMTGNDGQSYIHAGEYLVLDAPSRIVQTFHGYAKDAPPPEHREFLEITLRPLGPDRTELTLADCWDGEGMDPEGEEAVQAAWSGWLDGLTKVTGDG